jgi:hypothetical protein
VKIRDRIREFRRVPARELRPNPKNWRLHPQSQQDTLRGVLSEIGYADALLARELPDGSLELIDGHMRAETTPDMEVPVLVLDVSEAEADKLLALGDPLGAMAETDEERLSALLAGVQTESAAVQAALDALASASVLPDAADFDATQPELEIPALFQVVAECRDEADQQQLFERLRAEGYACRLMNL